jgi:hypothetical protein
MNADQRSVAPFKRNGIRVDTSLRLVRVLFDYTFNCRQREVIFYCSDLSYLFHKEAKPHTRLTDLLSPEEGSLKNFNLLFIGCK